MQLTLAILFASLSAVLAAPANLEPRQTYIITCIGGRCTDNISRPTSAPPQPTSSKITTTTTKKPEPSKSTYTPEPPETTSKPAPKPTSTPTPTKTTIKTTSKSAIKPPTKTTSVETGPSSTACPVPQYYKCGGWDDDKPWDGCTVCVKGSVCVVQNEWYSQCVAEDSITAEIIAE